LLQRPHGLRATLVGILTTWLIIVGLWTWFLPGHWVQRNGLTLLGGEYNAPRTCDEARSRGLAPARRGQPGYAPWLDRDHDGIACEPWVPRWWRRSG
jgi:hypothetical protein